MTGAAGPQPDQHAAAGDAAVHGRPVSRVGSATLEARPGSSPGSSGPASGSPLAAGETVLLVDRKKRRYLFELTNAAEFHTHGGVLAHNEIIGATEGVTLRSSGGMAFVVLRPTLGDVVLKMPRGAQVIYPKDLGPIVVRADVFPGARVLEAGVGSGALSMALLRAGAAVTGYERRKDFLEGARSNVRRYLGAEALGRYRTEVRDVYDGIDETGLDRVMLDLPEPWRAVPPAAAALRPGGILFAYTPSVIQVSRLHEALQDSAFGLHSTVEVMQRSWHVSGAAVRPDHRMVAHTGFLTTSRLLAP